MYDSHASKWARTKPTSLSDFTGRPPVIDLCGDLTDLNVLDFGCGEGYVTRTLLEQPLKSIKSFDISDAMIDSAITQCDDIRAEFSIGNATDIQFDDNSFDLALGVFVYNYLYLDDTFTSFKEIYRVLKPGGAFVFSVPHPAFPFISDDSNSTFHFDFVGKGYFSARDSKAEGMIERIDGVQLPVQMCHKTIEDYFDGFRQAGFNKMPIVKELGVTKEHLEMNKSFFEKVADKPLHMAFRIEK